jgi:hypothetical protein
MHTPSAIPNIKPYLIFKTSSTIPTARRKAKISVNTIPMRIPSPINPKDPGI